MVPTLTPPATPPTRTIHYACPHLPNACLASLSRTPPPEAAAARLIHTLRQEESSVLSLTADERFIYSGSQGMDIHVWDRQTLAQTALLQGHTGFVLALIHSPERQWLFSSSGDSTVRIWCTQTLSPLYTILPHGEPGDIFSLAYVHTPTQQRLVFGCQNTALQWVDLSLHGLGTHGDDDASSSTGASVTSADGVGTGIITPGAARHKFFDSVPQPAGRPVIPLRPSTAILTTPRAVTPSLSAENTPKIVRDKDGQPRTIPVPAENVVQSAHYGYIYCMVLVKDGEDVRLVTGSGDEETKLWTLPPHQNPTLQHTFSHDDPLQSQDPDVETGGAVLALAVRDGMVFAGGQAGRVAVWDVESLALVRVLVAAEGVDVLSLSVLGQDLYACTADGYVHRWSSTFQHTASYHAHAGIILSSIAISSSGVLVTGAGDSTVKIWEVGSEDHRGRKPVRGGALGL
ncbi:hypothetical protein FRC12_005667, partial [Ceratobasidium sp. 428]